jgi:MoaA/NifB/PqqE/SkfB family radical SAM enzyme/glycosyltransferase involved in cell wall biosynthesis
VRVAILTRGDLFPANHGAAARIVRTAEALAAAGDRVCVVTDDRDSYLRIGGKGWENVAYGARFRAMEEWPLLGNQARAERWCRRVGYAEDESFLYRPVFDPAWWARAMYVGLREGIDVYHAEFPGYAAPAVVAARLLGGRSVLVEHNVEWDRLRQMAGLGDGAIGRIRRMELALARAVDAVVAVSEDDRRRLEGVATSVVPHGVDLERYDGHRVDLRATYGLGPGPVLLFHGTLHYAPNHEAVRFIADKLVPTLPGDATVLVLGLTPPRAFEGPRLRFTGPVDDLPGHLAGADIAICPLFAGGGTRLKLLEYFAAALPVVATPLGAEGLPVRDGAHLLLADGEHFAAAVRRLLSDAGLRASLGRHARAFAAGRSWQEVTSALRGVHRGERVDFVDRPALEAHLPPRVPSKPLTMLLLVNRGCNLRCVFCDLWDEAEHLPFARVEPLFSQAEAIGTRTLVITGGEPLLHPELAAIVATGRRRGMAVNITTNGTFLDRHHDALIAAGVASFSFSIDGLPATHDRLRGQKGAHQKTWTNLVRTVSEGRVGASVYFVVTRENVRELATVARQVRALGAGFDFWPVNDAPELYLRDDDDRAAWNEAVLSLAAVDEEVARKAHYYAEALGYHDGRAGPVRCLGLVDQYGVTFRGDLLPCCVWGGDGLVAGNVFARPLDGLWRSPEVQARRERLFHAGCTAGCYNHSLYEFTASTGLSHRVEL